MTTAKALAAATRKPLIGVDHLHGHVAANFLEPEPLEPPFLCLIASGGHTLLAGVTGRDGFEVLGQTLDDAAGEAFDKGARLLGLGYPGGPAIERLAAGGDPDAFDFPVAMTRDPGLDFSFSGLKTALLYAVRALEAEEVDRRRADLAAGYQAAIVGQLVAKLERALAGGRVGGRGPWRRGGRQRDAQGAGRRALSRARAAPEARARRALHRQRGDDRVGRPLPRARPVSRVPGLGCPGMTVITLYTRPGCHLCDEARDAIVALRSTMPPFELREVNIEHDDDLLTRYLERIPVVAVDGETVSELEFDLAAREGLLDTVRR